MKKSLLFVGIMLMILISHINDVSADEPIDNLLIAGLDQIQTEYEAGINPNTINFVEGLSLYSNTGTLTPDKILVDYLNVDFQRVGNYDVYYYVIYVIDNQEVRFDIVTLPIQIIDTTKPILKGVQPIFINRNGEVDYLAGVSAVDNDKSSPLNINVFNHSVDLSKEGIYNIGYFVSDTSGNYTKANTIVVVQNEKIDNNLPQITVNLTEFNIKLNQYNMESIYTSAIHATDGDVDLTSFVQYDDSGVDYQNLGEYEVIFMVFDRDGNFTYEIVPVNVLEDNAPPYFENLGDTYNLTINTLDLKNGIIAYDDVCGDVTDRIKVTYGIDFRIDVEGYYDVVYTVSDLNGNESAPVIVTVHVYDNLAPVITSPDSLYLKINETLDISKKIIVTDNYDDFVNFTILDNNLNATKIGTYIINVSATDKNGNEAIKNITIYVYDPNPDEFYKNPIVLGSFVAIFVSGVVTLSGYTMSRRKRRR